MTVKYLLGMIGVYILTCMAWLMLAGVTAARTHGQASSLRGEVSYLWGEPQNQKAPELSFLKVTPATAKTPGAELISDEELEELKLDFTEIDRAARERAIQEAEKEKTPSARKKAREEAEKKKLEHWVVRQAAAPVSLAGSDLSADLKFDPRRKGLVWYSLYDVAFAGNYRYLHENEGRGYVELSFTLPSQSALYDGLVFEVNGEDRRGTLDPATGRFSLLVPVEQDRELTFRAAYKARGTDLWNYSNGGEVQRLENFRLAMSTDFARIDFPQQTVSPTTKSRKSGGWELTWDFRSTVTGQGIGMVMPEPIQPGELATALTLSAPVSLLFFFIMLFVVATLQKQEIHPMNYLFLGAAFFAFHLLFAYLADHVSVPWSFGISSAVSLILVTSYLRLVVSPRFALREAGIGQLIYLIGFSLAHFWEGFTGLTITVLAVLTLFILMQATGRIRWREVFQSDKPKTQGPLPPVTPEGVTA